MRYLRKSIKRAALVFGIYMTPVTSTKELMMLIRELRPVSSGRGLVRVGPDGNGGYLLPDDFEGIEALFSPGVGSVSLFEEDCADLGMKVFLADKSVEGPSVANAKFTFIKKFIGSTTYGDYITLDEWVSRSDVTQRSDLLLQMDIEGAEYEAFFSVSDSLMKRFRIIVVEFHELDLLFGRPYFEKFSRVFEKILQSHVCVHIHPNNCCGVVEKDAVEIPPVMEFTFIRRDRLEESRPVTSFPHALDYDSAKEKSLPLPKCWYEDHK